MDEQTAIQPPPVPDARQASRMKRTGQTALTLFVVFVILLPLGFGRTPLSRLPAPGGGYQIDFDLFSTVGVGMGLFALVWLLARFRTILRLPAARKVLGLVGAGGLILHTVLALFMPLGAIMPVPTPRPAPATAGPGEWEVDGTPYTVTTVYVLDLPEGLQYTIEHPHPFGPADANMDDARALEIAFPLMRHAYEKGLYKGGPQTPSRIGVVLYEKRGGRVHGYRIGLSLDEIRQRGEQGSP